MIALIALPPLTLDSDWSEKIVKILDELSLIFMSFKIEKLHSVCLCAALFY